MIIIIHYGNNYIHVQPKNTAVYHFLLLMDFGLLQQTDEITSSFVFIKKIIIIIELVY